MGAIAIGNCTSTLVSPMSGMNFWTIVTPATADDGDTVDISTVVGTVYSCFVLGATDGVQAASVSAAGVVTIPGSTDNEARTIYVWGSAA